jgi:hypothetical protein
MNPARYVSLGVVGTEEGVPICKSDTKKQFMFLRNLPTAKVMAEVKHRINPEVNLLQHFDLCRLLAVKRSAQKPRNRN